MPYPNGKPTVDELEENAHRCLSRSTTASMDDARLLVAQGQVYATLAVAARLEAIVEVLPGAGRGY